MWKNVVFWFCTVMCLHTHGEVRHFGRLPEVRNSLPVNLVQKVSKSVSICKSYCKTFTGTFLWTTTTTLLYQRMQKNYTTCYHAGSLTTCLAYALSPRICLFLPLCIDLNWTVDCMNTSATKISIDYTGSFMTKRKYRLTPISCEFFKTARRYVQSV